MKKIAAVLVLCAVGAAVCIQPARAELDEKKSSYTGKEVEMILNSRKIFSDNLTWERVYALKTIAGAYDIDKVLERLNRSQDDIANIFRPYYGDNTADQLANLLKRRVQLVADYANIVRGGGFKSDVQSKMDENAELTGDLLSRANMYWAKSEISAALKSYNARFEIEIDLQSNSVGAIDAAAFDATSAQASSVADLFATGIIKHHPNKFW
ncbi:MAG TPA: hypothetical protein DEE98_00315 [Elusimicrobia bacterium]|nr:MAG: hypothetical protein A2278_08610 [Elusimicrobia bacterium RIFOXYA12_FULL_49_49]OGS09631.1 MAG: hypothetical protein A2204_04035 [Elusimicrobia bacterium RIFOXYA1_FULL_47_7]OGS10753.1 MAG: hypothetical protein A2386_01795 [Elusimicrobia bacterium RIFOXYB1_FULL_48_9]OGS14810.1 MAG: hypothetical protein A2251_09985 [Elusimicrobia bacterium RIFOXYA2_FULL_47_53]OGS25540.1 MAG: hypothetical protein A2339_05610 [Elusimicrobia bacterium RIFOXYB12_FULL_50_12]OGS28906.1 MAG: hypothetical protein